MQWELGEDQLKSHSSSVQPTIKSCDFEEREPQKTTQHLQSSSSAAPLASYIQLSAKSFICSETTETIFFLLQTTEVRQRHHKQPPRCDHLKHCFRLKVQVAFSDSHFSFNVRSDHKIIIITYFLLFLLVPGRNEITDDDHPSSVISFRPSHLLFLLHFCFLSLFFFFPYNVYSVLPERHKSFFVIVAGKNPWYLCNFMRWNCGNCAGNI